MVRDGPQHAGVFLSVRRCPGVPRYSGTRFLVLPAAVEGQNGLGGAYEHDLDGLQFRLGLLLGQGVGFGHDAGQVQAILLGQIRQQGLER